MATSNNHPFSPPSLVMKDYIPNTLSNFTILSIALPAFAAAFIVAWLLTSKDFHGRPIPLGQRLMLSWFGLCGMIHCILEGYFTVFHQTISSKNDFLAQIWKEYGRGDSRYMIADGCTLSVECVTVYLEGPVCFLIIWTYLNRSPSRYLLQMLVSTGQLYGTIIYLMTEFVDDFVHTKYGDLHYFWGYLVAMNIPWIIVPIINICHCYGHLRAAQVNLDAAQPPTDTSDGKRKTY